MDRPTSRPMTSFGAWPKTAEDGSREAIWSRDLDEAVGRTTALFGAFWASLWRRAPEHCQSAPRLHWDLTAIRLGMSRHEPAPIEHQPQSTSGACLLCGSSLTDLGRSSEAVHVPLSESAEDGANRPTRSPPIRPGMLIWLVCRQVAHSGSEVVSPDGSWICDASREWVRCSVEHGRRAVRNCFVVSMRRPERLVCLSPASCISSTGVRFVESSIFI